MSKKRVTDLEMVQLRPEDFTSGKSIKELFEDARKDGRVEKKRNVELTCVTPTEEQLASNMTVAEIIEEAEAEEEEVEEEEEEEQEGST